MHRPMVWTGLVLSVAFCSLAGCATTTVRKNPGRFDRGIRYYRPKPYLLLQPAQLKDAVPSPDFVQISLEWLPDFSEEYSIHIRAGLGTNKTTVTLDKGWNLTSINVDVDSKVPENIRATADLLGAVGKFIPSAARMPAAAAIVRANNVPLGFYESVISRDSHGVKRLYGWRYIGFMPYSSCPVESGGLEHEHCETAVIYGLVVKDGVMTFLPLPDLAGVELKIERPAATVTSLLAVNDAFRKLPGLVETIERHLPKDTKISLDDITVEEEKENALTIVIQVSPPALAAIKGRLAAVQAKLGESLLVLTRDDPRLVGYRLDVNLRKK